MDDLKLFTREEVAELFNVHVATITMLKDAGVLSAIKIGKGYIKYGSNLLHKTKGTKRAWTCNKLCKNFCWK